MRKPLTNFGDDDRPQFFGRSSAPLVGGWLRGQPARTPAVDGERMKVAVVRSLSGPMPPGECHEPVPEASTSATARVLADALADAGHTVIVCEADGRLLATLERFMPFTPEGAVTGLVFNLARGGN